MSGRIEIRDDDTGELLYQAELINRTGPLVEAGMIVAWSVFAPYRVEIEP